MPRLLRPFLLLLLLLAGLIGCISTQPAKDEPKAQLALSTATQPSGKVSTATYDANGNAVTTKKTTNVSPTTPVSSFTRTYDSLNRVTQFSTAPPAGGVPYTLNYTYDNNGNLATLVYETGKTVTYAYDNRNRLTSVTDWLGKVTSFTYDKDGRMLTLARPNGSTLTQAYDADGNLLTRTDAFSNGTISALGLTYDADNRVTGRQMYPPMQPSKPASLTPHTATFTADNKINQLTGTGMQFPAYDADENLTSAPSASSLMLNSSYAYDADNKLTATTNPDGTTATYAYDAEGNRISVVSTQAGPGNGTTQFVVDPQASLPRILWRIRPNGTRTFYIYGGGLLYEIEESTSAARYYHFDSLGSTVAISEQNGTVSARGSYSTYGAPTSQLGNWDTPFQWCGAGGVVTDPNGLISMRARFYHPGLGRFMNRDPMGLAAGPNCFAYCNGNPVMGWDPSGLCTTSVSKGLGGSYLFTPDWDSFDVAGDFARIDEMAAAQYHAAKAADQLLHPKYISKADNGLPEIGSVQAAANMGWAAGKAALDSPLGMAAAVVVPELAADRLAAGWAVGRAAEAAEGAAATAPNRIYSARELIRRGAEPGPFHNFPESFNKTIFENGTRTVTPDFFRVAKPGLSNDGVMYRMPGTVNGVDGVFEIGVRPSVTGNTEVIGHRFFNPNPR